MVEDLQLILVKNSNPHLYSDMWGHYSNPYGFVGRNICYLIYYKNIRYGSIVGGSATKNLPGREEFFKNKGINFSLNEIINNTFFHIEKQNGIYPVRNFSTLIIKTFREIIVNDWIIKYENFVVGFETLIELPRTGECYIRDKWICVGETKGFTCKRFGGKGTDDWGGRRVWNKNKDELRPKLVLCREV